MNYQKLFQSVIDQLTAQNRYRDFLDISRICGQFPWAVNNKNGRKITVWCSNDYLGLAKNKAVKKAAIQATKLLTVQPVVDLDLSLSVQSQA